jgi:hypothetical protein
MDEQPTEEDTKEFAELQDRLEETHYGAIGKGITAWSRTEGTLSSSPPCCLTREWEAASHFDSPKTLAESMILLLYGQQGDSHG